MGTDHFGDNFVGRRKEGNGVPLLDLMSVSLFGEERLMDLVPKSGEEGSRKPVLCWAFLPLRRIRSWND